MSKQEVFDSQYVRVRPDNLGGRELFGLFVAEDEDDHGAGRVFNFSNKRFYLVAKANCRKVESYDITDGLMGLSVRIADFGVGIVIEEWVSASNYHARVRNGANQSVVATISMMTVQIPAS